MLQFVFIMIHAFQLLFIDCNYPKAFVWWIGLHAVMFFFLFNEFYHQSYAQKKSAREAKTAAAAAAAAKISASNGTSNGKIANGTCENGVRRKEAADYYVKGDSIAATELSLRKPYATIEWSRRFFRKREQSQHPSYVHKPLINSIIVSHHQLNDWTCLQSCHLIIHMMTVHNRHAKHGMKRS